MSVLQSRAILPRVRDMSLCVRVLSWFIQVYGFVEPEYIVCDQPNKLIVVHSSWDRKCRIDMLAF